MGELVICGVKSIGCHWARLTYVIHRHLKEIDHSLAMVGGSAAAWAMAMNLRENQYTGPAFSAKACFMVAGMLVSTNIEIIVYT